MACSTQVEPINCMVWQSLVHQGPPFPPPYVSLPQGGGVLSQGLACQLPPEAEEAARLWVGSGIRDIPEAATTFSKHFNNIQDCDHRFEDLDLSRLPALKYHEELVECDCWVNGIRATYECPSFLPAIDSEGNFYPRVRPQDVEINVSEGVVLALSSWKHVWCIPQEDWLARWSGGVIEVPKFGPQLSFDKARSLKSIMSLLRRDYRLALDSHLWQERQWATTLYFVDALTLPSALPSRPGKNDGLRCSEVQLVEPNLIKTRLGQYFVHRRVFLNLALFIRDLNSDQPILMSYSSLNMLLKLEYGDACTHLAIVRYNATALCVSRLEKLQYSTDLQLRRIFAIIWNMLHEPRELSTESVDKIEHLRAEIVRRKLQMWDKHRSQCRQRLPRAFFKGITSLNKERYLSKLAKASGRSRKSPAETRQMWSNELEKGEWKRPKAFLKLLQEIEFMESEIASEHMRAVWAPNNVDPRVIVAYAKKQGIQPATLFGGMHRKKTFEWALGTPAKWDW